MHPAYYSNSKNPILQSSFEQIHFPKHSCYRDIAEIQAVQVLLQEIQFYKSTSSSGSSFIHSTLLRAPIGKNSTSTSKNIQLVIHHSYALTWTRDSMQNQGHSSRTRILRGRSNKLLENKFYCVYRLIQDSNPSDFKSKKGRCCNIDQIGISHSSVWHFSSKK